MIEAPIVASVEAWLVRVPLERPLRFVTHTWTTWNYVVVRVRDADGRVGAAYSFLGEVPLDLMATELVAPAVVGSPLGDLRSVSERCALLAGPPLCDVVRPAASLVEVCLWDLAAQRAGLPLWALLRPKPLQASVRVMYVEHRRENDTPESFAERIAELAARGVEMVKIKHYGDADETAAALAAIRSAAGERIEIVVDVGWLWSEVETAIREAGMWTEHRLAWIEDPFPPSWVREAALLREAVSAPIAVGDLITSIELAERLIYGGAADVLRVDVTTLGGIAGVERLAGITGSTGVRLSPELFSEVHQHLAIALPGFEGIEIYSPDSGVWSGDVFVRPGAVSCGSNGKLLIPEAHGSGLDIDWAATKRHAVRYSCFPA